MFRPVRGFNEFRRAWYSLAQPDRPEEFNLGKFYAQGGCDYEFRLVRSNIGAWKFEIFHDAMKAIKDFQDVFKMIGELKGDESAETIRDKLIKLGLKDFTKVENPYG